MTRCCRCEPRRESPLRFSLFRARQLRLLITNNAALAYLFSADLELRLYQHNHLCRPERCAPAGKALRITAGSTSVAEMKDTSIAMKFTVSPIASRSKIARVRLLQQANPRVLTQFEIHLPIAGIDRNDPRRAMLQQAVRKSPVEAPTSRQIVPATSIFQCSRARSSFSPPRLTYFKSSPSKRIAQSWRNLCAGLLDLLLVRPEPCRQG